MTKESEASIALKFIKYFEDNNYEVYKEVGVWGNIIDFVAVSGCIKIAVEVKTSLNFKVIEQAYRNLKYFNYSYIAVPLSHNHFAEKICKDYGIGILYLMRGGDRFGSMILEDVKPKLNRKRSPVKLCEYMKNSVAGSQNNRITPFRNTITEIVHFLECNGRKYDFKKCMDNVQHHYNTISSAKANIYQWCKNGVITEFSVEKGILYLPPKK